MKDYNRQLALDLLMAGCLKVRRGLQPDKIIYIDLYTLSQVSMDSNEKSPIYIDLRILVSYPSIIQNISKLILNNLMKQLNFNVLCGVPFAAIAYACNLSILSNVPLLLKRQEAKSYGTKKMIEGKCVKGERVLIIEDIITSGQSILKTVIALKEVGLIVEDVIVILDREQGGCENLKKLGIRVHSLIKLNKLFEILVEENHLSNDESGEIMKWIENKKVILKDHLISSFRNLDEDMK